MLVLGINYFTKDDREAAFACSQNMQRYLVYSLYYFLIVSIRHLLPVLLLPCTTKPQRLMDICNILYLAVDVFVVVLLTVYGTQALFNEVAMECRYESTELMRWWVVSVCTLLFGWVYTTLLCIGLASLPLICLFWCFYKMQISEIQNEQRLQRIPFASNVLKAFSRKRFGKSHQLVDQCVICLD